MTKSIVICNATVIDTHTGEKTCQDILVQGEKILAMAPGGSMTPPDGADVVEAKGRFVIPGLWDAHIHLTTWPEMVERMPALLTGYGVTSVRDMGAKLESILAFREQAMATNAIAPRVWFAGPFINSSPAWGHEKSAEVDTEEEAVALIDKLAAAGIHFVKTYEMLLPEVFKAIAKRAEDHGLRLAGHAIMRMTIPEMLEVTPTYDLQHLGGQCAGMSVECTAHGEEIHRQRIAYLKENTPKAETGCALMLAAEAAAPTSYDDRDPEKRAVFIKLFAEKGTWQTPTLVQIVHLADLGFEDHAERLDALKYMPQELVGKWRDMQSKKSPRRDAMRKWGAWYIETVGMMHEAGIPMMAGTDCPPNVNKTPGLALHLELEALVKAGLSPLAALQTATVNPAKYFGMEDEIGSLAQGKYADLVLLDGDPLEDITNTRRIAGVLSRGQYYDRPALDDIFAGMVEGGERAAPA